MQQTEKPNKRVYAITPAGKAELLDRLSAPEKDIKKFMQSKNVFLLRLAFAGETSDAQALDFLHLFRKEYLANTEKFDDVTQLLAEDEARLGAKVIKYWKLVALHGKIMRKARLDFVNHAIGILENERACGDED